jgi:hypothetical protein
MRNRVLFSGSITFACEVKGNSFVFGADASSANCLTWV